MLKKIFFSVWIIGSPIDQPSSTCFVADCNLARRSWLRRRAELLLLMLLEVNEERRRLDLLNDEFVLHLSAPADFFLGLLVVDGPEPCLAAEHNL